MFRHLACGAALAMLLAADSWAVLKHRYTFENGTANDTAGTAHGTLMNGAQVLAGQVVLPGLGASSDPLGQHVSLPAATIAINTYTAATIEQWVSVPLTDNGGGVIDFRWSAGFGREGTAADATDPPPTGLANDANEDIFGHNYISIFPTRGGNGTGRANISRDYFNAETGVNGVQFRGTGQHHIAATLSSTGPDATTLTYYVDGVLIGSATGAADLNEVSNDLAYLGRSLYDGDLYFAGAINEFRIHDNALTAAEVQASFVAGPAGAAGPTLTIDRGTGAVSFSNLNTSFRVVGYTLDSAAGALDPVAWQPVQGRLDDAGNGSFDPDDNWFVSVQTANSLAETSTADGLGADDGAVLGASNVALGAGVWEKYFQEEVSATLRVRIDAFTEINFPANVVYTGNGGQPFRRSDLNFDNAISGLDWVIFRTNALTSLTPGLNDVQSYVLGDVDGDQDVDFFDFRLFQDDFDAANGAGAFEALLASVPEPGGAALVLMGIGFGAIRRRRRS